MPRKKKILIVDDQTVIFTLLETLFFGEADKYELLYSGTVSGAKDVLAKTPVDVIVLDICMCEETGYDFLGHMTKAKLKIPVIVFTGLDSYEHCRDCFLRGAADFITKRDAHLLKGAIERLVG